MKTHASFYLRIVFSLIFILISHSSFSEAFCALRDPVSGIYKLYPQATGYRSIVRTIDQHTRTSVRSNLPNNTLHFGELGRHTLYIALRDGKTLGMVHVRSEESAWGLVEIAWAINLDMTVHDFTFQRARSSKRYPLEEHNFRRQLMGKNYEDIKALLIDGQHVNTNLLTVPPGAETLSSVLLRSSLKTLLITQLAWKEDLQEINLLQPARLGFIDNIVTPKNFDAAAKELAPSPTGLHTETVLTATVNHKSGIFATTIITVSQPLE